MRWARSSNRASVVNEYRVQAAASEQRGQTPQVARKTLNLPTLNLPTLNLEASLVRDWLRMLRPVRATTQVGHAGVAPVLSLFAVHLGAPGVDLGLQLISQGMPNRFAEIRRRLQVCYGRGQIALGRGDPGHEDAHISQPRLITDRRVQYTSLRQQRQCLVKFSC